MASMAKVTQGVEVFDGTDLTQQETQEVRFVPGVGTNGKRESVSLTGSAFTALSPPSGAKAVCLILGSATSLKLKGVTGDTGVALTPSSNPLGIDAILPLGASPSIGILNSGSTVAIEVIWL